MMRPTIACLICALLLITAPVDAQSSDSDEWQFQIAPLYLWATNLDGTMQLGGGPSGEFEVGRECQGRHFCIFVETLPLTRDRPPAGTPIFRTTLDVLSALAPVLATGWTPQWRPTVRGTTWSRRAWTGGTPHSLVFCRMGR